MASTTRPNPAAAGTRAHRVVVRRGRAWPSVAAERLGGYDTGSGGDGGAGGVPGPRAGTAPFGLPVLAEVPALASALERLTAADAAMLTAVAELADLLRTAEVEATTGVGIDHWLAAVATQTRMDRRLLVRTCRLLHRLPSLDAAVRAGRLSFAQLRGVALVLRGAPAELDGEVDRLLAALLDDLEGMERPDPDVLVRQVADALDELRPDDLAEREDAAAAGRYLALQPTLDGTGGRFHGQLDAAGLALLDAATTPPDTLLDHPGGYGAARADTLLARLAASDSGPAELADTPADPDGPPPPPPPPSDAADVVAPAAVASWLDGLAPPKLIVRVPFDALLDDRVPADLLTRLVGGRLRLTPTAARRLLDARGAQLRSVIVDDDGSVLGVGRASRQPPGWLSDVLDALHDTCGGPGCDRPARGADADHAVPWWPTDPDDPPGTTDVDNLGPLCPTTNRAKEAAGWRVAQTSAGIRTWHHPRSGLRTTTVPATWRAADDPRRRRPPPDDEGRRSPPCPQAGRRPPPRPDDPGPDGPGAPGPGDDPARRPDGATADDDLPF